MKRISVYVQTLTDDEKRELIQNYEDWEKTGSIGDVPLRTHTECFLGIKDDTTPLNAPLLMAMERFAFECYRYFAELYLKPNP